MTSQRGRGPNRAASDVISGIAQYGLDTGMIRIICTEW
jgi:hypothetical protein